MLCTVPARKLNLSSHIAPNQAVDNRDPDRPVLFSTEYIEYGPCRGKRCAADAQHGTRRFLGGQGGRFPSPGTDFELPELEPPEDGGGLGEVGEAET